MVFVFDNVYSTIATCLSSLIKKNWHTSKVTNRETIERLGGFESMAADAHFRLSACSSSLSFCLGSFSLGKIADRHAELKEEYDNIVKVRDRGNSRQTITAISNCRSDHFTNLFHLYDLFCFCLAFAIILGICT